jgi:hypothetical protein
LKFGLVLLLVLLKQNILEAFGINVFVSGFATNQRSLEQASHSQRTLIRLSKGTPHLTYSHYT